MTFIKIVCLPLFRLRKVVAKIGLVPLSIFKYLRVFDLSCVEVLMFRRDAFLVKSSNWDCAVCLSLKRPTKWKYH